MTAMIETQTVIASVSARNLAPLLDALLTHASTDNTRPCISGALLKVEDGRLVGVATDGHRLIVARIPTVGTVNRAAEILVSRESLESMRSTVKAAVKAAGRKADPQADLAFKPQSLGLACGALSVSCARVDEHFPPYTKVIPEYARTGIMPEQMPPNEYGREVKRGLACGSVGISPSYLADALSYAGAIVGDGGAKLHVGPAELDPVCVYAEHADRGDVVVVIMPMRV